MKKAGELLTLLFLSLKKRIKREIGGTYEQHSTLQQSSGREPW